MPRPAIRALALIFLLAAPALPAVADGPVIVNRQNHLIPPDTGVPPEDGGLSHLLEVQLTSIETGRVATLETRTGNRIVFPNMPAGNYRVQIRSGSKVTIQYHRIENAPLDIAFDDTTIPLTFDPEKPLDTIRFMERQAREAQERGDTQMVEHWQRELRRLREMHSACIDGVIKHDPKNTRNFGAQHHAVVREASRALQRIGAASTGTGGNQSGNQGSDPLIGTWKIAPLSITNPELCGNVTYHATISITRMVSPGRYKGTNSFRWDTSRADPDCVFKFDTQGTVDVDVQMTGDKVVITYLNTGRNTFVPDTLTFSGTTMSGHDGVNAIVFTRQ